MMMVMMLPILGVSVRIDKLIKGNLLKKIEKNVVLKCLKLFMNVTLKNIINFFLNHF